MNGVALYWLTSLKRLLTMRGFIAAPGAISLTGIGSAAAAIFVDRTFPDFATAHGFRPEVAQAVLSTLAGATMTALTLVYSITLIVFTLAAGSIAPRLLERFAKDRVSQFAVGALGALFLHALVALAFSPTGPSFAPVAWAVLMALAAVLLLLFFVDRVAKRVTIDEEVSAIARGLDAQITAAATGSSAVERKDMVLPESGEAEICARGSGYIDVIAVAALTAQAAAAGGVVDFRVAPGDHVFRDEMIGRAFGPEPERLARAAEAAVKLGQRRTQEGDLRFSVSLLVEIALRALSPGVNDSFTAITCIDRLAASFAEAAARGLNPGVFCDAEGAARVVTPGAGLDELIPFAFDPIRQACRNNLLAAGAALSALRRLTPRLEGSAQAACARQVELLLAEVEKGGALEADLERLRRG
ncbi:MAG: DUF2254 family protein [Paracoccaceae bacterium]